jgi:hypothetical protein
MTCNMSDGYDKNFSFFPLGSVALIIIPSHVGIDKEREYVLLGGLSETRNPFIVL